MRWTRKAIAQRIQDLHQAGVDLSYARAEAEHISLVRAATWHFGTWRLALEAAGLDPEQLARYQKWNRERVAARIRELHAQGADLSWRNVSTQLDPALAAAALRPTGFGSWRAALEAAGLDADHVSRYAHWDAKRITSELRALRRKNRPLSSKAAQIENPALFCAARRHFGSWDAALEAAGLDASAIRLRKPRAQKQN
jgi:hypothetical protein